MGKAAHLTRRFFTSLSPHGPSAAEEQWARDQLIDTEVELWRQMRGIDRRHAVGVAHRVEAALGPDATRPVLAAALLHDVGKIDSDLGVYGRVVATLSAAVAGPDAAYDWVRTNGFTRRVGLYLLHPKIGGDRLGIAGSDPFTEAWTREHHLPEDQWTVDVRLGRVLKEADDD
jgi:hypothetical protein